MTSSSTQPRAPRRSPNGASLAGRPDGVRPEAGPRGLVDPLVLNPGQRRRRALTLLLLTLVAPGSAQYVAGHRGVGRIALRTWLSLLVGIVLLGLVALLKRSWLIGLFSRSFMLLLVALGCFVLAVGWAALFINTLRLARLNLTPPKTKATVSAATALLMLFTSGGLVWAGQNTLAGRSALLTVFGNNTSKAAANGRYNILLLGGDSGASRVGTRPDTIMLASVDAESGKTLMFGFARDTENINFREGSLMRQLMPEGWNCGDQCLLNGLYTWAIEHKDRFPADIKDPGAEATKQAVEALSGLDIQYYALVDLKGFRRLVDAVGGITVNVKTRTPIGGETSKISGYIEPGVQHLDGYHALWYARSRTGSSNYARMARQRCVLNAMLDQLNPQTVLLKFQDVAAVSGSVLTTDIPESDLGTLADLALKAKSQKMASTNFVSPLIKPWDYDPQVIKDKVKETIEASAKDTGAPKRAASASSSGSAQKAPTSSASAPGSNTPKTPKAASSSSAGGNDASADDVSSVCSAA